MSFCFRLKEKRCFQCDLIKFVEDFNKGMKRCKNCESIIVSFVKLERIFVERMEEYERERYKEKYYRFGYKDK